MNAGVVRPAAGPAALSNLPAIEGLKRDIVCGVDMRRRLEVSLTLRRALDVDDADWDYVSSRANGKTQVRLPCLDKLYPSNLSSSITHRDSIDVRACEDC